MNHLDSFFNLLISHNNQFPSELESLTIKTKLRGCFKETFPQLFKEQWVRNQLLLDEVNWLINNSPLSGVLLKGVHLFLKKYYRNPGERFMGDIDILIKDSERDQWDALLKERGFSPFHEKTWEANSFKYHYQRILNGQEQVIELHTRLFFQEERSFSWETTPLENSRISLLTTEDLFIHLCGHIAYQHTFISLHWLYDIYKLLINADINWNIVQLRARQAHVFKSCQLVLWILQNHFSLVVKTDLFKVSPFLDRLNKTLLTKDFLTDPYRKPILYWLIKHLTKDTLKEAITYDLLWFKAKYDTH